MWTRFRIKEAKEALDFKIFDAPKRNTLIKSKFLSSINTLESSFKPEPFNLHNKAHPSKMANQAQNIYLAWDNGVPITLDVLHDIPTNFFKILLYFDATLEKITYDHYVDVASLAKIHNIQHEDFMVRLLA